MMYNRRTFFAGFLAGVSALIPIFLFLIVVSAQTSTESIIGVSPKITKLWPESGGKEQFITIDGSGFGYMEGEVSFIQGGSVLLANTELPGECKKISWRDSYIVVKVPERAQEGAYTVKVKTSDGRVSNTGSFTVTRAPANPGICGVIPDNGPAGSSFTLYGSGFGTEKGKVTVGGVEIPVADSDWKPNAITALIPSLESVPSKLRVVTTSRTLSNPINITSVTRCVPNGCGAGQQCCSDGSCRPDGFCEEKVSACRYTWTFSTGDLAGIGAACTRNEQCISDICTNGVCVRGDKGVDQACTYDGQCQEGLKCDLGVCALVGKEAGEKCTLNSECLSSRCENGVCLAGAKSIGASCKFSEECKTKNCFKGVCAQSLRCVSIEETTPKAGSMYQNSVFRVRFNQLMREDTIRPNVRLSPDVPGRLEVANVGTGDQAKTEVAFHPSQPLSPKTQYKLIVGDSIASASSNEKVGKCSLRDQQKCNTAGAVCDKKGDLCSNGARCIGETAVCSGKGTICMGPGSKCLDGALCLGTGSTCIGAQTQCTNTGSICRARAECTGAHSRCEGLGTRCIGEGSACKDGAACVGKNPIKTPQPASCDKAKQTCTSIGSQCKNRAICLALDSVCSGPGTACSGNASQCNAGATCTGSKSKCSDPGTTCTGSESECSKGAKCTGIDSTCSGVGTQCTGSGSTCTGSASCSGAKSQCLGSGTSCSGVASKCNGNASCPNVGKTGAVGCPEGTVKCADALCRSPLDKACKASLCNTNAVCDANESCNCSDCFGKQSACQQGFVCSKDTKSCQATVIAQSLSRANSRCDISAPNDVIVGTVFSSAVTLRNTGTTSWDTNFYSVSSQKPAYTSVWGRDTVALPIQVNPGQSSNLTIQATAPAAPGTYVFAWQLRKGNEWVGELCARSIRVTVPPIGATCNSNAKCEAQETCSCLDCASKQECTKAPEPFGKCGNSIRESGEQCDDGNKNDTDACANNCWGNKGFCGNGLIEGGEQCDDGDVNNTNACSNNCRSNKGQCGNSLRENNEECDDGNTVDLDQCRNNCVVNRNRPICGDGIRELSEQCDDGNQNNEDACRTDCRGNSNQCGNGSKEGTEQCDDGDTKDDNACTNQCKSRPALCGNGQADSGEECDDGDKVDDNACRNDCTVKGGPGPGGPVCGNGKKEGTENCDDADQDNTNACKNDCTPNPNVCGNGLKEESEVCDDGDTVNDNACHNDCTANIPGGPVCRNGLREDPEVCDDGDSININACRNDCTGNPGKCGNGMKEQGEQCDDGDMNNTNGCTNTCTARDRFCGNGKKEATEQCDDGDAVNSNQCRNDCTLNRTGPVCGNGVREFSEQCDDGNQNNGDSCRADCIGNSGFCGNGIKEGTESCDDGDQDTANTCSNECKPKAGSCGNGVKEGAEKCDDGDRVDTNQCKNDCTVIQGPYCGDGVRQNNEQCDDGNQSNDDACRSDCRGSSQSPQCGNGAKEGTEQCDDGDRIATNACKNDCTGNPGFCGNGTQEIGEQCDDGDRITTDQCRNDCSLRVPLPNNARCSLNAPATIRIPSSELQTGHPFSIKLRLENTGTKAWSATSSPAYIIRSESPLDTTFWSKNRIDFPSSKQYVAPGDFLETTVSLVAPVVTGQHALAWQLMAGDEVIGERCMVDIRIEPQFTNDAECTITVEAQCGDGVKEGLEQCDDGDHIDTNLCKNDCTLSDITTAYCGNGKVEAGEQCDDGNTNASDVCRTDCVRNLGLCGNGIREGSESCDDGNSQDADVCTNACTRRSVMCGNGIREAGEQCDDGNTNDTDGCTKQCRRNAGFCGNGVLEAPEQCDDGDSIDINACTNACTIRNPAESICGNAKSEAGEQCDDGNFVNTDLCKNNCTLFTGVCGNGVKEGTEGCDDGDTINYNQCTNACTQQAAGTQFCGNGKVESGEQCDDGNTIAADQCRTDCRIASGFCGNGIREGSEQCDDGNRETSDTCTNECKAQPAVLVPDKDFALQVTLKNTGTKIWNPATHVFGLRDAGGARIPEIDTIPLRASVPPQGSMSFAVRAYTPQFSGVANLTLQMREEGTWFGESCKKAVRLPASQGSEEKPKPTTASIDHVSVFVNTSVATTTDAFMCSLDTGCLDDANQTTIGNQHIYRVKAYAADNTEISPKAIQWTLNEAICGNGIREAGEQCDDQDTDDTNACTNTCSARENTCGNGKREGSEQCDDGNHSDTDKCTNQCRNNSAGIIPDRDTVVLQGALSTPQIEVTPKRINGTSRITVTATGYNKEVKKETVFVTNTFEISDTKLPSDEQQKIASITAIRLTSNGDALERDAFGCIGNTCADDANAGLAGNQHRFTAEFFDKDRKPVSFDERLITWTVTDATSTISLSASTGRTIFVTNSDQVGSATLTLKVTGSDKTKNIAIENKYPRRECLGSRESCGGGPDQQGDPAQLATVVIEANDRPLNPDVFTCFGSACVNDRSGQTAGNQRSYHVRLHGGNNSLFPLDAVEKIEWTLANTNSFTKSDPFGTKGDTISLTNTEVEGSAALSVTVTPKSGNPVTVFITVTNILEQFQVRDIVISTNGQFLNQDAFGCVGDTCADDRATSQAGNQHRLDVYVSDGQRYLTLDPARVHWSATGDTGVVNLSATSGTTTIFATNTAKQGSVVVTVRVDGISAIGSLALENKHPYKFCTTTTCTGLPDKSGSPDIAESVIIDTIGRPIPIDRLTCEEDGCPEDTNSTQGGNQHTYEVRIHAQNNSLLPLTKIQRIQWSLSSSQAFSALQVSGTKGQNVVLTNTAIPGTATLAVTIIPIGGTVQTAEIVLVNDVKQKPPAPPPPPGPQCGNGKVETGEQCDDGDANDTNSCRNNCTRFIPPDCTKFWQGDATSGTPSATYNFALSYCVEGKSRKLPQLMTRPTSVAARATPERVQKPVNEYFYRFTTDGTNPDASNPDVLIVRVYENTGKVAPIIWYKEAGINPNEQPSVLSIDGLPSLRDSSGYYINVPVIANNTISSYYIFNFSTNSGAQAKTREVLETLLTRTPPLNARFLTHIQDEEIGKKIRRDVIRTADISFLTKKLADFKDISNCDDVTSRACYPQLISGTYIRGQSISGWQSWTQELGKELGASMSFDPIQTANPSQPLGKCGSEYDQRSCWSEQLKFKYGVSVEKALENGVYAYTYRYTSRTDAQADAYTLCTLMEYPSSQKVCSQGIGIVTTQSVTVTPTANQKPSITVTSPAANQSITVTSKGSFTVKLTATDTDGAIKETRIYRTPFSSDSTPLSVVKGQSPHTHTISNLSRYGFTTGEGVLAAIAVDNEGLQSDIKVIPITVSDDLVVTIISPQKDKVFTVPPTSSFYVMSISITISDPTITKSTTFQIDDQQPITYSAASYGISYNIATLSAGKHILKAFVTNTVGKESAPVTVSFEVNK